MLCQRNVREVVLLAQINVLTEKEIYMSAGWKLDVARI